MRCAPNPTTEAYNVETPLEVNATHAVEHQLDSAVRLLTSVQPGIIGLTGDLHMKERHHLPLLLLRETSPAILRAEIAFPNACFRIFI